MPLKKSKRIVLVDETQREYRFTLDKDSGLLPGHYYRFYFWQSAIPDTGYKNMCYTFFNQHRQ